MNRHFYLLLFLPALFLACELSEKDDFDKDAFEANRRMWQARAPENYSFYLVYSNGEDDFWSGTVVVKDGTLLCFITDSNKAPNKEPNSNPRIMRWINTMNGIYDEINKLILETNGKITLKAEYDDTFHFIKYFSYNQQMYTLTSSYVISYYFTITKFVPNPEIEDNLTTFDRETFDNERRLWQGQNIQNYSFRLNYTNGDNLIFNVTIVIKDGRFSTHVVEGGGYYDPWFEGWRWVDPISNIYDTIIKDSNKNPGLEWGRKSQSVLELEYDSEYHFPKHYRYFAEEIPTENQSGNQRLYEFFITDFTHGK